MIRNMALAVLTLGCLFVSSSPGAGRSDDKGTTAIPADPDELRRSCPATRRPAAKVELGKMLYFDPRLSASHAISCNSCHNLGLGGADAEPTSIGHRWQHGGRNAPTVLNAVFNKAQFWDGRAKDLEQQAGGPMVNPVEMASPDAACGRAAERHSGLSRRCSPRLSRASRIPSRLANAQKAIAVFEATLITPNAPFDRFLKGDANALSPTQKAGLALFMDKGCSACHNGINVGGGMYAPFGVVEKPGAEFLPPADKGRFMVTKTAERRVRLQGPDAAEHRADGALFPHRESLGSATGGGGHGDQPARHSARPTMRSTRSPPSSTA